MVAAHRFEVAELLDIASGESVRFHPERWLLGEMEIRPRGAEAPKVVRTLRVWPVEGEKMTGAPYWDITAGTLIEALLPHLRRPNASAILFVLTKEGVAPRARWSVELQP